MPEPRGRKVRLTPAAHLLIGHAGGHTVMSAAATMRLLGTATGRASDRDRTRALLGGLTGRETQVLACLVEGLSNAQIAGRLHLSEATVKGHVSRVLDKLGCANRTQAGLIARDADLG